MRVFLLSCVLLAAAWLVHFLLWRIRLPRHHIPVLLLVFAGVLGGWLAAAIFLARPFLEIVQVTMFYVPMALCYVITYSAIEGDSPTLSLMRALSQKGTAGMNAAEVENFLTQRPFVAARLAALLHSGLVREEGGHYVLRGMPSLFFRLILAFRKLYGPISRGG